MAVLDMTAGHIQEEPGYGYLRPQYVIDRYGYPATKAGEEINPNGPVPEIPKQKKSQIAGNKTKLPITQFNELELVLKAENDDGIEEKAKDETRRINRKVVDQHKDKLMINSYSQ